MEGTREVEVEGTEVERDEDEECELEVEAVGFAPKIGASLFAVVNDGLAERARPGGAEVLEEGLLLFAIPDGFNPTPLSLTTALDVLDFLTSGTDGGLTFGLGGVRGQSSEFRTKSGVSFSSSESSSPHLRLG